MSRLPLWRKEWEEAEQVWDQQAEEARKCHPLKELKDLPQMVGIVPETARGLKWKSFKWMVQKDEGLNILRQFFKHPFKYGWRFLKSVIKPKSYRREGDFFLYGLSSLQEFEALLKDKEAILVVGFSYCHKPFECPSGRFSASCIHDPEHPVCQQCFIGKAMQTLHPQAAIPLFIPTIHYVGNQIFEIVHRYPGRPILFMITACELTLEMFGDWGNMVDIRGVGVRLAGRICNNMRAFELSEQGVKPGLTVVLDETKQRFLQLIRCRNQAFMNS